MQERRFILRGEEIRVNLIAFLQKIALAPVIEVIVREFVDKRTVDQNARLWLLHTAAAKFVGCTAEDMHEDMLCKIYGYREVEMPSGDVRRIPLKRSSQRNKREFRDFMDQVESFYISELGVYLDPWEQAA